MITGSAASALATSGFNLRQFIETHRSEGKPIGLTTAVDVVVQLCVNVAELHRRGFGLYVYPSNVVRGPNGFTVSSELATSLPGIPPDQACLAPETQPGRLGDARTSVYSIGAIFYELLTGYSVGPNMRRPSELVPHLPAAVEVILAKALIRDPGHRPADLHALAQALYALSTKPTIPPPPVADASLMDKVDGVEVDISLSMLPPPVQAAPPSSFGGGPPASVPQPHSQGSPPSRGIPASQGVPSSFASPQSVPGSRGPLGGGLPVAVVASPKASPADAATAQLAALKARLEADPTPRYVVIKDGMDHGPFNAVELLQQIRTHAFEQEDVLQNSETREERPIKDWPDFAPFAEHAYRHKAIIEEKAAVHAGVARESKRTRSNLFVGLALLATILAGAGYWFVSRAGTRNDEVAIQMESVANIEAEGAVKSNKQGGGGARASRVVGTSGGVPQLAGGQSCEAAQNAYVEEIKMTGGQADISRGQYANIMNSGNYFSHCGVPSSVAVNICVAVQSGRAVGVTVNTSPNHPSRGCITNAVRGLKFPSHPKLDVVRVNFAAQ